MNSDKKILIFVEGESDKIIIQAIISKLEKNNRSNIIVTYGDLFTTNGVNQQTVRNRIAENVRSYCRKSFLIQKKIF